MASMAAASTPARRDHTLRPSTPTITTVAAPSSACTQPATRGRPWGSAPTRWSHPMVPRK